MLIDDRPVSSHDHQFVSRLHHTYAFHHAAYREVVVAQYGSWDDAQQDQFFLKDWANGQFVILMIDDTPCGYACVEERTDDTHVRELVVDPMRQNRGIGTTILRCVMAAAARRGVPVRLGTQQRNRAQQLYRRLGFREIDRTATHVIFEWTGEPPVMLS